MSKRIATQPLTTLATFALTLLNLVADPSAQKDRNGNIVLENQFIMAIVSPTGGNVVVFEDKVREINHAVTDAGAMSGMAKMRVFEDLNCREFYAEDYDMEILRSAGDEVLVECSRTATDRSHAWRGFELVKRYSLRKGENRMLMEWTINAHNNTGTLTPFMHNYLRLRERSYAFAQTSEGLLCRQVHAATAHASTCMVRNVAEPWGAIVSPETQDGIIGYDIPDHTAEFLFWLDESKPTIEPRFQTTKFAMDSSWRTEYVFAPLRGLRSCHFAAADYAAGFCMEDSRSVLKFLPFCDMGATALRIHGDTGLVAELSLDARSGTTSTSPVPLAGKLQRLKVEVTWQDKSATHNIWASPLLEGQVKGEPELKKDEDAGRECARCRVSKGKMFVCPEMVVPLGCISVTNKLPRGTRHTVELVMDVPQGIELMNPTAHWGVCHDQISEANIELDGQAYTRYVISKLSRINTVFAETDWPAGTKGVMHYQIKWDGGEDTRQRIAVESVHIPEAPFPKLLITNIPGFGMRQGHIDSWPGFYDAMRRVGCNTISSSGNVLRMTPEDLDPFFRQAQEEGFYTFANYSPFHLAKKGYLYTEDIANFPAVSLMGEKSDWPCPSYRGKAFRDQVATIAAAGKLGASMLELDTECWSGGDYCYCERCLARFKAFMAERHPDRDWMDPREFRKAPQKFPQYTELWNDFKAMLGCEMYRPIVELFKKNIEQAGTPGPFMFGTYSAMPPDRMYSMFLRFDDLLRQGIVNHAEPSAYTRGDALKLAGKVRTARGASGNSNILTWMSAGEVYPDDEYPGREFRYGLLENFLNGARGYLILPWFGLDADDLREHAIAMQMVVPVEDIILHGTVMKSLQTSDAEVKICGLQKGAEQLVLLSEYYGTADTHVSLRVVPEENCRAVNMLTGEVVARLSKGPNTIDTVIPKDDRCVLIYIGNRELSVPASGPKREHGAADNDRAEAGALVPDEPEGKVTVREQGRSIVVANPFYRLTFFAQGNHHDVRFPHSPKTVRFYSTNSMLFETHRVNFPDAKSKRDIVKSPDGGEVRLSFSGNIRSEAYSVDYRLVYTFCGDTPVVRFAGEITQDPVVQWQSGSINTWYFDKAVSDDLLPNYRTGPVPEEDGVLAERGGSIVPRDWKKGCTYSALHDGANAFGMIAPSPEDTFIYSNENGGGYITGCRLQMDGKSFRTTHHVYLGPVDGMAGWARKLYPDQNEDR